MSSQKPEIENLSSNETDVAVAGLKGLLSLIPIVGSILSETIAFHIPNQRIDRLENFAKLLSAKFENIDDLVKENLKDKFNDPKSLPFLEKILNQVIKSEWQTIGYREGTKGKLVREAVLKKVWVWKKGTAEIEAAEILISRKADRSEVEFSLCNEPS